MKIKRLLIPFLLLIPALALGWGVAFMGGELPSFVAPITHTAVPTMPAADLTFTRNTTKTVTDFQGVLRTAKINEVTFKGARRVENLCTDPEVYATETITVFSGIDYIFAFTGTGSVEFSGAATGTLAGTGANDRVQALKTTASTSLTITVTGSVLKAQLEQKSGSQTVASEYVSSGVLSDPWHGAGVDAVKYFNTDRSGDKISEAILKGYRADKEATNTILQSEDMGTTWVNSWGGGTTLTLNDTIAPNGTKTADKIAQIDANSNGNNQSVTLGAATIYKVSCYFKNIDSTESRIFIWDQNASAQLAVLNFSWAGAVPSTSSSSGASNIQYEPLYNDWYRISFNFTTAGTVTTHLIILFPESSATATNSVYVWGAMINLGAFPTAYIKTLTTTVTRTPDALSYDNPDNKILPNSFSAVLTTTPVADGPDYEDGAMVLFSTDDSGGDEVRTIQGGAYAYTVDGGGGYFTLLDTDFDAGVENKYGFQLFQNGADIIAKIFLNGVKKLDTTDTQTLAHSDTALDIGFYGADYYTGTIKDFTVFSQKLSDVEFIRRTQ